MGSGSADHERERHGCTWPGCRRAADVLVEYVPGDRRSPVPGAKQWLGSEHATVKLCDHHAAELPAALGSGRVVGRTRI